MSRLKKLKKIRLYSILLGIVLPGLLLVVSAMIGEGEAAQAIGGIAVYMLLFLFLPVIIVAWVTSDKLKSVCHSCGGALDGAAYKYNELSRNDDSNGNVSSRVEFSAECPHCGTRKTFTKKYLIYQVDQNGNGKVINHEPAVRKHARKYFGH